MRGQIRNPETEDLGLENHVCELQLLLRSFAELKVMFSLFRLEDGENMFMEKIEFLYKVTHTP